MAVFYNWMILVMALTGLGSGILGIIYPKKIWSRVVQLVLTSATFFSGLCILYMKIQEHSVFGVILLSVALIFLYSVIMFGAYSLGKYKEKNKAT